MPENIDSPEHIAAVAEALQRGFELEDDEAVRFAHALLELVEEEDEESPAAEEAEEAGALAITEAKEARPDRRTLEGAVYGTAKGLLSNSNVGATKAALIDLLDAGSDRYGDDWAARIIGQSVVDGLRKTKPTDSLGKTANGVPPKVKEIAEAIARDHPEYTMEQKFRMAWAQYKKMKGKKAEIEKTSHIKIAQHITWAALAGAPLDVIEKLAQKRDVPAKVEEIADAIRRDNPQYTDEQAYRMAWQNYCTNVNADHPGCTVYGKTKRVTGPITPTGSRHKAAQAADTGTANGAPSADSAPEAAPATAPAREGGMKPEGFTPTGDGKPKVSQKNANYRSDRGRPARRCGNCRFFNPDSETCDLVKGHIVAGGLSDIWAPRKKSAPKTSADQDVLDAVRQLLLADRGT